LAEARRLNPKLTMKWMVEHVPNNPAVFDGLRNAGLPEGNTVGLRPRVKTQSTVQGDRPLWAESRPTEVAQGTA
jgi:hypothetical protein